MNAGANVNARNHSPSHVAAFAGWTFGFDVGHCASFAGDVGVMNCFEKFPLDGDSIIRTVIENVNLTLVDSITDCSSNLVYWRYLLWLNAAYPRDHVCRDAVYTYKELQFKRDLSTL
jgi:hypothetical protein